jgi:hypothetical protein
VVVFESVVLLVLVDLALDGFLEIEVVDAFLVITTSLLDDFFRYFVAAPDSLVDDEDITFVVVFVGLLFFDVAVVVDAVVVELVVVCLEEVNLDDDEDGDDVVAGAEAVRVNVDSEPPLFCMFKNPNKPPLVFDR